MEILFDLVHLTIIAFMVICTCLVAVGLSEGLWPKTCIICLFVLSLVPVINLVVFAVVAMWIFWRLYSLTWIGTPKDDKEQK